MPKSKAKGYVIPKELIICEVDISPFPDKVLIANKRRTYYKKWSKYLPKKYKGFGKNQRGELLDLDGNKVVRNTRTAGKPRFYNLSGQDLWSFNIHPMVKSKVSESLKRLYYHNFKPFSAALFDGKMLGIEIEFQGPLPVDKNGDLMEEDLDNMERWHKKAILDALCGNVEFLQEDADNKRGFVNVPNKIDFPSIIQDDNLKIVRELPVKFTEKDMKKVIVRIYEVKK